MGRDKAWLTDGGGEPWVTRVLAALRAAEVAPVGIAARSPDAFEALEAPVWVDRPGDHGPLEGIRSGLRRAGTEWVVAMACDVPGMRPEVIQALVAEIGPEYDAVVPVVGERWQVLAAAYRVDALAAVEEELRGRRSVRAVVERVRTRWWEVPEGLGGAFRNVNTPDLLVDFVRCARRQECDRRQE